MARKCTQAWGPSLSVSRTTDHSMETDEEVPVTTASVSTVTKTSSSVIPASSVTSASPSVVTAHSTAVASTSSSTVTVATTPSPTVPSVTVPPISPSAPIPTASVLKPKFPRPLLSAEVFRSRFNNTFPQVELPHFEHDPLNSKIRAYIVKRMFESKELGTKQEDLLAWT